VAAELPAAARWEFECRYMRVGFPDVYHDPEAVHVLLVRALELDDLDDALRQQLIELRQGYTEQYEALCRRLAQADTDHKARDRFTSERAELNRRTARQLRQLLDLERYGRITAADDAPDDG
jgi:hypothetical protein